MVKDFRHFEPADVELRFDDSGGVPKFRGYAAVFNSLSKDLGGFREVIRPGAFRNALSAGKEIACTIDHDVKQPLGLSTNGTVTLREDTRGLYFEVEVPDVSYARDAAELVKRGLMRGCSFGFYPRTSTQRQRVEGGGRIHELLDIDVFDVGPVFNPAYAATSVSVRNYDEWQTVLDPRNVERWLKLQTL